MSLAGGLAQLSEQKGVLGVMALTRNGALIQRDGDIFSGDAGKTYARVVHRMIEAIVKGITELEQDDLLKFVRIHTDKHELLLTPSEEFVLVALRDPNH